MCENGIKIFYHQSPVVAVSGSANGHVEVYEVVCVVRLRLSQIPLDAGASQDDTGGAEVKGVLCRENADPLRPLHPDSVLRHQVLNLVKPLAELGAELVDVVH